VTQYLPTVNAALNALATMLLLGGYVQIRHRRERAHRNLMLAAFGVSMVFLICYLVYHAIAGSKRFEHVGALRSVYFSILITHVALAATVPLLAGMTIYLGLRDRRAAHRRLARWTFPVWLYVSVTGVVIYALLYHLPAAKSPTTDGKDSVKTHALAQPAAVSANGFSHSCTLH
jgi:uncharacterized membrane protein YozB (DUF420 family)